MEFKKNDLFTARIEGYTSEGAGVCRLDGCAVFVPGTLKDELWEIRIVKTSPSFLWGRGEKLLEASPVRQDADCTVYPRCGGCAMRHMSYKEELRCKLQRVNDSLQRIGGLSLQAEEILGAEPGNLRQKVIWNIGEKNGKPVGGFYRSRSHEIIPCENCPAVPDTAKRCLAAVLFWMKQSHIPAYDEAAGTDGIRHVFVRSSRMSGAAVLIVTSSLSEKRVNAQSLIQIVQTLLPEVSGIVWNHNTSRGNTVLSGDFITLWGCPDLQEQLCGLTFSLSPRSFFQVNPAQAEKLYQLALDYADIQKGTTALDLYCGTGTIGLCMAGRGAKVIGSEIIPAAVENARENAKANHLEKECEFLCGDAAETAATLAERGIHPEVVVVDPPRKGLEKSVIHSVVSMQPQRVVYVSCDPGTLARDLKLFSALGYCAQSAKAVDMFPRTAHVETVVLLSRA